MERNVKETRCQQLPKILIEISFFWFLVVKPLMKNIVVAQLGAVHKLRLQEEGDRWSKNVDFCQRS